MGGGETDEVGVMCLDVMMEDLHSKHVIRGAEGETDGPADMIRRIRIDG